MIGTWVVDADDLRVSNFDANLVRRMLCMLIGGLGLGCTKSSRGWYWTEWVIRGIRYWDGLCKRGYIVSKLLL